MLIEKSKTYKGEELAKLFFRPSFTGPSAEEMGIRVLYNMPMPTIVHTWKKNDNVLQEYSSGWTGQCRTSRDEQTIYMRKVKAESSFSAADYFTRVYEKLVCDGHYNMGDLSGTELEAAETELFRRSIAEAVRATMWCGDMYGRISNLSTFNGFLYQIDKAIDAEEDIAYDTLAAGEPMPSSHQIFSTVWEQASPELKSLLSEGNLALFVTSDIYHNFIAELDDKGTDSAYRDFINGHEKLAYHGIPIIEVPLSKYMTGKYSTFAILTDRRNLVLALNTADMPDTEVRMWYNPDEMENRQRACFLAGTHVIDTNSISIFYNEE